MEDFEKLGAFYLGKTYDVLRGRPGNELVLYDSRDLTTHAVIIGMTGSGKTGLGIALLEEAAIDRIPVIAIDPKGDLGNILLTFPDLSADQFRPWTNAHEAEKHGLSVDEFASAQAARWRDGLAEWGQSAARIRKLREAAEMAIFTPGSSAGIPVSVLKRFACPPAEIKSDKDLYREKIAATATSVLALMGIAADPITSREHILISNLLEHTWDAGRDTDVAGLIGLIQTPPFERIGVLDLESFYPSRDRFGLAMKLNSLLASPGFEVWMQGQPLDAGALLYTETGKPRLSVVSIAHLSDTERMFFVTMLLNEILGWMRTQPGTTSLRAVLYMDEIFGYMPPTANPPSKVLLLTLLKQARAFGLGVVLSTQNPVDLDYKGLSNTGTWFIGRLQTERDKMRVMDGLEGAAAGSGFDREELERVLAGLGKRTFLLHNVHDSRPVVFSTRWVMSYLSGPLTRDQIRALMADRKRQVTPQGLPAAASIPPPPRQAGASASVPALSPAIRQYFLPLAGDTRADGIVYHPFVVGAADVLYSNARHRVETARTTLAITPVESGPVPVDWASGRQLGLDPAELGLVALEGAAFGELSAEAANPRNYGDWEKLFNRWLRNDRPLRLFRSPEFNQVSRPEETEGDFRARLQTLAHERRDQEMDRLRKRYAARIDVLENRLLRAEQALEREEEQSRQSKFDAAISFGTAILGAFLGRKVVSQSSAARVGTTIRKTGRMRKEAADVERARETAERARADLESLQLEFDRELERLQDSYDAQREELGEIVIKPKSMDIHIHFVGLAWAPYRKDEVGRLLPAWPEIRITGT